MEGMASAYQNRSEVSGDKSHIPVNMNVSEMSTSHKALFRARDIDQLKVTELDKISGKITKKFFFYQIRRFGGTDADQFQLALSRMDESLRRFVFNRLNSLASQTLQNVEDLLDREFQGPPRLAKVVKDLFSKPYTLSDNPREFANFFKTQYEILCSAFPEESLPDRETMLKQILVQDLPVEIRNRLDCFMTKGFSEELFINELDRERLNPNLQVDSVQERLENNQQVRFPPVSDTRNRLGPYPCRYCQDGNRHTPRNCPLNPPPGGCYDCLSSTHRRGDRGCPGRTNREVQRNDPQRPQ